METFILLQRQKLEFERYIKQMGLAVTQVRVEEQIQLWAIWQR
jgi:hypothetical protein